jgi:hypothetical protein
MSGHDIAAKPHKTTHERVTDTSARIPVRWTRWPNVKPREVPAREQRHGPRASRFNDLAGCTL